MNYSVEELLLDHQPGHSDLQMDAFITRRNGITMYGCFFQALRELFARESAASENRYAREQLLVDIDELEACPGSGFEKRRNLIRLEQKIEQLQQIDTRIRNTENERQRFYQQACQLRAALESQGVQFPLDHETKSRLDEEMWEAKLKGLCAIDFMTHRQLQPSTIALMQSCPAGMRRRIVAFLDPKRHESLMGWFMSHEQQVLECSESSGLPKPSPRMLRTDAPASPQSNLQNGLRPASLANSAPG